jgi:hypothetical protein
VVNRNAFSVYQTDAVLILLMACNGAQSRAHSDETVQSTSMFKKYLLRSSPARLFRAASSGAAIEASPSPNPP